MFRHMAKQARQIVLPAAMLLGWTSAATAGDRRNADIAGPRLSTMTHLPGVSAYNRSIDLYSARRFENALEQMRNAIRSRDLQGRQLGFGFANLCLMYLRNREYKQAFAACVKAKLILPGYGPVLVNIRRIKAREALD